MLLFVSSSTYAQKSAMAVMNVSVSVISGATISELQSVEIDFEEQQITEGGFALSTPKSVDTLVGNEADVTLTNQFGESITMKADSKLTNREDFQSVDVATQIDPTLTNLRGTYQGLLTTTVEYF